MYIFIQFAFLTLLYCKVSQADENGVKFLLLKQEGQDQVVEWIESTLKIAEEKYGLTLQLHIAEMQENDDDYNKICNGLFKRANFILDVTWYGSETGKKFTADLGVPYLRVDVSISPMLKFLDDFLIYRNATDVVVVFSDPKYIDESLYYWLDTPMLRLVIDGVESFTSGRVQNLRPVPHNVVLIATSEEMPTLLKTAIEEKAVTLPERWNLLFLDYEYKNFDRTLLNNTSVNILTVDDSICCNFQPNCDCNLNTQRAFTEYAIHMLVRIFAEMKTNNLDVSSTAECNSTKFNEESRTGFYTLLDETVEMQSHIVYNFGGVMRMKLNGTIAVGTEDVAGYNTETGVTLEADREIKPIKTFYRVGTTHALPWSYQERDEETGELYWTGYCIDFLQKLSEVMNFDYEIVPPKNGTFGEKTNGVWDGVIGDLARGDTDMAFTAMVMTADREEVVDFIPPYFEQSGISIVIRKPVRKTSLFKFMTVLKLEVWLSIVGALTSTGFMVWFLDKYSPYSARNNKKAYPYPCREFTLKESFWFALTSFTPQGGGEAPKCLSGRTLVAAYWLFVVLMLATFTANLAAFLTVERMQTPVQSLEQLARQSRINYTVVEGSETHKYFINMKFAEDTLYRMWKELTLNASIDDTRYRVWDYPIREQYGRILLAINDSIPVKSAEEGFRKVDEHLDADFAFIHDSSEIKYEITRNCNLTEVGEVFAEKPYAIAVQQGYSMQDEISRNILYLQRDRFFEHLQSKYWNHSTKTCSGSDDSEGITLESLGGVFIATLFGLGLAMITLAGEVLYYKRKAKLRQNGKSKDLVPVKDISFIKQPVPVTIGTTFNPVIDRNRQRISNITLYPRARNRLPIVN